MKQWQPGPQKQEYGKLVRQDVNLESFLHSRSKSASSLFKEYEQFEKRERQDETF
jgi:hypothetical protein